MAMGHKHPKAKVEPHPSKTPKRAGFDENPMRLKPAWRVGHMEMCHPFGWHCINGTLALDIISKLRSFESMTWAEILGARHHAISTEDICKEARERLVALKMDDQERLISLAFSGKERVWGVLEHNVLTLLWWDPEHTICPSPKKHT